MANLVLACKQCNRRKRDTMPEVFLKGDPQRYRAIASGLEAIYAL
jgi:5-methylcytosine-specific restriction endonuclease McrA